MSSYVYGVNPRLRSLELGKYAEACARNMGEGPTCHGAAQVRMRYFDI